MVASDPAGPGLGHRCVWGQDGLPGACTDSEGLGHSQVTGRGQDPGTPACCGRRREAVPELQASGQGGRTCPPRLWAGAPTASPRVSARGGVGAPEMGLGKGPSAVFGGRGEPLQALGEASLALTRGSEPEVGCVRPAEWLTRALGLRKQRQAGLGVPLLAPCNRPLYHRNHHPTGLDCNQQPHSCRALTLTLTQQERTHRRILKPDSKAGLPPLG